MCNCRRTKSLDVLLCAEDALGREGILLVTLRLGFSLFGSGMVGVEFERSAPVLDSLGTGLSKYTLSLRAICKQPFNSLDSVAASQRFFESMINSCVIVRSRRW